MEKKFEFNGMLFDADQMQVIKEGLEEGLDVTPFADPKYNWQQMVVICRGIYDKLDITKFNDPSLNHEQMQKIYNEMI